ncbi:sensor histidine kinase [Amycolatopsis sp. DSM 110486]|uniref:sensor histidine kinase n=1 Tax=Amycolatopsis sp. DSM 110486 TaxID=2865832 RepID=UPI001C69501B|nr:sensor histidine kinase [Amycolatopsis sp. DSM 110486]QYN24184.1 sensor histidine kinase [Amycolatopsis sp. DSM 110486]
MSDHRWRNRVTDVLLAVVLVTADVIVGGNMLREDGGWRWGASFGVALTIALAVVFRRRWPIAALACALTLSVAAAFLGVLWDPFAGSALVLYLVALSRRDSATFLAVAAASAAIAGFAAWWFALGVPVVAAAWAIGRAVRDHRAQAARLDRQRQHQILIEERLRIARDLHDVVTHGMGLIAVKAGVANHVADSRPEEAREALRIIEETSREALSEMRRLLDVLREEAEPLSPAGLADLPQLAERVRPAGVDVDLCIDAVELPPPVALAAYRIVQEAITNVIKHAAPARCQVLVRAGDGVVRIEITDDGTRARPSAGRGHGIVGMTERAALFGGKLEAKPLPGKGFRVEASLRYAAAELSDV